MYTTSPFRFARPFIFFAFLAFVFLNTAFGSEEENLPEVCKTVKKLKFPAQDLPSREMAKSLNKCSSRDLYYGFDKPADPVKARLCAYVEREKGGSQEHIGDSAILMMIYANGEGVKRNLDLALKLACEVGGAPAEIQGRLEHLETLKQQEGKDEKNKSGSFSLCDDITSGYMMGVCKDIDQRFTEVARKERLSRITAKWSEVEKKALQVFQIRLNNFIDARSQNEVDLSGSMRAVYIMEEEVSLREAFLNSLEEFEKGKFPNFTTAEYLKADTELNAVYRKLQNRRVKSGSYGPDVVDESSSVTKKDVKKTEQVWLKYRDAWVIFAATKYPKVSAESWKTWLIMERTKMLKDLLT